MPASSRKLSDQELPSADVNTYKEPASACTLESLGAAMTATSPSMVTASPNRASNDGSLAYNSCLRETPLLASSSIMKAAPHFRRPNLVLAGDPAIAKSPEIPTEVAKRSPLSFLPLVISAGPPHDMPSSGEAKTVAAPTPTVSLVCLGAPTITREPLLSKATLLPKLWPAFAFGSSSFAVSTHVRKLASAWNM
eukprot:scaffold33_cov135-Pinguiococcus_pyrenoidosus.AAC.3